MALALLASGPASAFGSQTAPDAHRVGALIEALRSTDGRERVSATRELFRLDGRLGRALQQAGARLMTTTAATRLDAIYTLASGAAVPDARPDSFGIIAAPGATRRDIATMGARHGFVLPPSASFTPDAYPTCYVRLQPGRRLADVLRDVLETEPLVVSVTLNRVDR